MNQPNVSADLDDLEKRLNAAKGSAPLDALAEEVHDNLLQANAACRREIERAREAVGQAMAQEAQRNEAIAEVLQLCDGLYASDRTPIECAVHAAGTSRLAELEGEAADLAGRIAKLRAVLAKLEAPRAP